MKEMIHSFLYISFLPLLVFTSFDCSTIDKKSDDKQLNDTTVFFQNEFFPVSVGNQWHYSIDKPSEEKDNYDVKITSQEKAGKEIKVVFDTFPFFWLKIDDTCQYKCMDGRHLKLSLTQDACKEC